MLKYSIKIDSKDTLKEEFSFSDLYIEPDLSFITGTTQYETNLMNGEEVLIISSLNSTGERANVETTTTKRTGTVTINRHYPIVKDKEILVTNENKIKYDYIFRNGKYYYSYDGSFLIDDLLDENGKIISKKCSRTPNGKMAIVPETYWIENGFINIDKHMYIVDSTTKSIRIDENEDDYEDFHNEDVKVNIFNPEDFKDVTKFRLNLSNKQEIPYKNITYGQYYGYITYQDEIYYIDEKRGEDGYTYFTCTIDKHYIEDGEKTKTETITEELIYKDEDGNYLPFSSITRENVSIEDLTKMYLYIKIDCEYYPVRFDIRNDTTGTHLLVYTTMGIPQIGTNDIITFEYGGSEFNDNLQVENDNNGRYVIYNGQKHYIEKDICNKVIIDDEEYEIIELSIDGGKKTSKNLYVAIVNDEYILLRGDKNKDKSLQRVSMSMVSNNGKNEYASILYKIAKHDGVKINNVIYQLKRKNYIENEENDEWYIELNNEKSIRFIVEDIKGSSMIICKPLLNENSFSKEEIFNNMGMIASEVFGNQKILRLYTHNSIIAPTPITPETGFGPSSLRPNSSSALYDPLYRNDEENIANTRLFKQSQYFFINIPNTNTQANNLLQENLLKTQFYDVERAKAIQDIVDMERDVYYPAFDTGEIDKKTGFEKFNLVHNIVFNLHFRTRNDVWKIIEPNGTESNLIDNFQREDKITNWFATDIPQYTELKKKEIKDKLQRSSDLMGYLFFTNNDIFYQKNKVAKSFLRLSFYDSIDPQRQMLLYTSTIFFDEGAMYMKYISHQRDEKNKFVTITSNIEKPLEEGFETSSIGVFTEPYIGKKTDLTFDANLRMDSKLSVKNKYESEKSAEGFYAYIFREYSTEIHPQDIYLKIDFNHAGIGKTIPMVLPMKWNEEIDKPDRLLKMSNEDDLDKMKSGIPLERLYREMYIPFECRYDKNNRRYVYYPKKGTFDEKWTPIDGGIMEFNLFELKIKDESIEK